MWNYYIVPHTSPPPILHILNEVLANKDNPQFLKLLYGTQVNSFQLEVLTETAKKEIIKKLMRRNGMCRKSILEFPLIKKSAKTF